MSFTAFNLYGTVKTVLINETLRQSNGTEKKSCTITLLNTEKSEATEQPKSTT